jgi:hypothetical protein
MGFQPGANVYTQGFGSAPENIQVPHLDVRAPTTTDINYPVGKTWVDTKGNASYTLTSFSSSAGNVTANWVGTGGGSEAVATETGDTGTAVPSAGNIKHAGTANQITTAASGSTVTYSLPSAITAPGSLTTTTTLTATAGAITATNGNVVLGTAGNKIVIATGSDASVGTSSAMSGTPGAVIVSTTASSATAKIFYSRNVTGGTPGEISITAQDGTGFTLTSTANETSTFNWWIINA